MPRLRQEEKSRQTIQAIIEATEILVLNQKDGSPSARSVISKSGYSTGTFYHFFRSVDHVIAEAFQRRQLIAAHSIQNIIDLHDPEDGIEALCVKVVDDCFRSFSPFPADFTRFAFKLFQEFLKDPDDVNIIVRELSLPMAAAAARDRTNTFRTVTPEEAYICLRGVVSVIRSPLLEGSRFFGSREHREMTIGHMTAVFRSP